MYTRASYFFLLVSNLRYYFSSLSKSFDSFADCWLLLAPTTKISLVIWCPMCSIEFTGLEIGTYGYTSLAYNPQTQILFNGSMFFCIFSMVGMAALNGRHNWIFSEEYSSNIFQVTTYVLLITNRLTKLIKTAVTIFLFLQDYDGWNLQFISGIKVFYSLFLFFVFWFWFDVWFVLLLFSITFFFV